MAWPCVQHLSFPVRDVERSRRFYRDVLGFRDHGGGAAVAELTIGGTKLVLVRADQVEAPRELHFGFREATREAVDAWGSTARAADLTVDFGPARAEWGGYVLYFRDPDGYQIEIWAD